MKRTVLALAVALALFAAAPAHAQYAQPYVQPFGGTQSFAPWLNLLRSNNPATNMAINYYGITRPELQAFQSINQLQTQVTNLQRLPTVAPPRNTGITDTGTPARFMTYGQYFMTQNQQTGARPAATIGRR
jgi:hypothetical protein